MTDTPVRLTATELMRRNKEYWEEKAKDPDACAEAALLAAMLGSDGAKEALLHFIRLGIWAEKHAVPLLTLRDMGAGEFTNRHEEALAALKAVGVEIG